MPVPPVLGVGVGRGRGWRWPRAWVWVVGLVVVLAAAVLHQVAPEEGRFYPRCGFHVMTGMHCAGCGSTRALHHLTHGRVVEAVRANAFLVVGGGAWLAWVAWGMVVRRGRAGMRSAVPAGRWVTGVLLALVVFTVLRNLPWVPFTWLAP